MQRIYEAAAYGPQGACFWADTVPPMDWAAPSAPRHVEVAVIGGGFTGLSAALHLAQDGVEVAVLEADHPGFGASGRNGGFCCLGGAKAPHALLRKRFGEEGLRAWCQTERAAIDTAAGLISAYGIAADTHSEGETLLAHTPRAWASLKTDAETMPGEVEVRTLSVPGVRDAEVKLVWDPPWDPSKMSDEARLELGML